MTLTKNKHRQITIIATLALLLVATSVASQTQYASAATCTPTGTHCYAVERKLPTTTTYGNKFTAVVPNIGGTSGQGFGTVETWIAFPNADFIEHGVMQGYLDQASPTTKSDEWEFAALSIMGVWQPVWLDDVSSGSTYTFEWEDDDGDYTWDARLNGVSKWQRIITFSRGIGTDVGGEVADDPVTIPQTKLYDVSFHNGSTYSYWSSAGFFGTIPNNNGEIFIKNGSPAYRNFCVSTSSISTCT